MNKDIVIYDHIKGTLIYKSSYYIFQPLDIDNNKVPLSYRTKIYNNRHKFIPLDITNINSIKSNNNNTLNNISYIEKLINQIKIK